MSAATMTEAEQERAARAKIDGANELRRQYAERKGISPHSVRLKDIDFAKVEREVGESLRSGPSRPEPAKPKAEYKSRGDSMSGRIVEAAKRLADADGVIDRAKLHEALGAADAAARRKINGLIYALRGNGHFPWKLEGGGVRSTPKPKPASSGSPSKDLGPLTALRARISGSDRPDAAPNLAATPKPSPAPVPAEATRPVSAAASVAAPAVAPDPTAAIGEAFHAVRLARVAAGIDRVFDGMDEDERAFAVSYVGCRFG